MFICKCKSQPDDPTAIKKEKTVAINLQSTNTITAKNLKVLVYGQAGAGKTSLIPTMPKPIILSAEGGLLSIAGSDIPFIEVTDMAALREAYAWLANSDEAKAFDSVAQIGRASCRERE